MAINPVRSSARLLSLPVALSLLGLAGAPADAAGAPPAPSVGACHSYSWSAALALSNSSPRVSCFGRHDALTVAVGKLPATMSYGAFTSNNGQPSTSVSNTIARTCVPGWINQLGSTRLVAGRSMFTAVSFAPTKTQWSSGARWFRCDIVLEKTQSSLAPLPLGQKPFLRNGRKLSEKERICLRRTSGPVDCSLSHYYTPVGARLLQVSPSNVRSRAASLCRRMVNRRVYAAYWKRVNATSPAQYTINCFKKA